MQLTSRFQPRCGLLICICLCLSILKEKVSAVLHWMKKQSQEEMGHAYAMADYIIKRGGIAKVDKIDVVPTGWGTPLEVFEHVFEHERHVSKLVDALVDIAAAEKIKRLRISFGDSFANK